MKEIRVLVAGVGNIFLGDDGFGVEVARRLAALPLARGVEVRDFGVRGFDLALALLEGHDQVVLVDAARRGGTPGTLYLLEAEPGPDAALAEFDVHGMVPSQLFRVVREMGGAPKKLLIVACEPKDFGEPGVGRMGLSASVQAAVEEAVRMVEGIAKRALEGHAAYA